MLREYRTPEQSFWSQNLTENSQKMVKKPHIFDLFAPHKGQK